MDTLKYMTEQADVAEAIRTLIEKKHSPFPRKFKDVPDYNPPAGKLGKTGTPVYGPPPSKTREVSKKDEWDCKCKGGKCVCDGKGDKAGRRKTVRYKGAGSNEAYRKAYNANYWQWRRDLKAATKEDPKAIKKQGPFAGVKGAAKKAAAKKTA